MRKRGRAESLESRTMLTGTIVEYGEVAYVFAETAPRVDRYDLAAESWLTPLSLDEMIGGARSAVVVDEGIFATFGNAVYRFSLDGGSGDLAVAPVAPIDGVFADDDLVFVQCGYRFYSLDAASNEVIEFKDFPGFGGKITSVSAETNRLVGVAAYDLAYVRYGDDGRFLNSGTSAYQLALPIGNTVWPFPGGQEIVTDRGTVFNTTSFSYLNSLGSNIVDVDFVDASTSVIATGQSLTRFNTDLFPESSVELGFVPARIFAKDDGLTALVPDASQPAGVRAEEIAWSAFESIVPGASIDPTELAYTPDDWRVAADGSLLLLSKANQSIFRWDPASQSYTQSIRLLDAPYQFTYSRELNVVLLGYVSGRVTTLDLNLANPVETPLLTLPGAVQEIESLGGEYFVTADPSYFLNHTVFTMDGVKVDAVPRASGVDFTWNEARQKLYFFLSDTFEIAAEEVNADGGSYPGVPPGNIGEQQHTSVGFQFAYRTPIYVAADGSFLIFRSGQIVDLATLELHTTFLTNWIEGAAWIGGELFTMRRLAERTQLQRWRNGSFINDKARFIDGEPLGLVAVSDDRLVAINMDDESVPVFTVLSTELEEIPAPYGIDVVETHGKTAIHESGIEDSVFVSLRNKPNSDVVVRLGPVPGPLGFSESQFIFTPENWNVPQTLTFSVTHHSSVEGWRNFRVQLEVSQDESDVLYRQARPVTVTIDAGDLETASEALAEYDGVVYVLSQASARIDRFALDTEAWLEPLLLGEAAAGASALHVDADGIFVAVGASVYRYDLAGGNPQRIFTFDGPIRSLLADDGLLIAVNGNGETVAFVDKSSNELRNLFQVYEAVGGASLAPTLNRIFGWKTTTSPPDIVYVAYSDAGTITSQEDSPYHGAEPRATRTWVFPNETKVFDNSGTVYATSSLARVGAIAPGIDDVKFFASEFAVLRVDRSLFAYSSELQLIGGLELTAEPVGMFLNAENLLTFTPDAQAEQGFQVDAVPLHELNLLPGREAVHPVDLPFQPDFIEQTTDGTLLMVSKEHRTLFRWNPATQQFGESTPLLASPSTFAYSADGNTAYFGYAMGLIYKLDLSVPDGREALFASMPRPIDGLAAAGEYLYVAVGVGRTGGNVVYRSNGQIVDVSPRDSATAAFTWSEANQKMYFLRLESGSNRLNWEEINANGVAYPGQAPGAIRNRFTSNGDFFMAGPLRIRPDGKVGLLGGSQQVFDAQMFQFVDFLPNAVHDAQWLGNDLFAVRDMGDMTQVQKLSGETYDVLQSMQLPGAAVAIRPVGDDRMIVVVRQPNSPPAFHVLDTSLATIKSVSGDTNYDGGVDLRDLNNVRNRFGELGHGDADGDGDVDLEDLNAVRNNFGTTGTSPAQRRSIAMTQIGGNLETANAVTETHEQVRIRQAVVDRIHEANVIAWQRWQEVSSEFQSLNDHLIGPGRRWRRHTDR